MIAKSQGIMLVISGPSGAGKTTVISGLRREMPELHFSVSCTTRPPRPGERDGVDYHFLRPDDFAARLATGDFLEHAEVHGHRYGTLRDEVVPWLERSEDVLLDIDLQGARQVAESARTEPLLNRCLERVFIAPPSLEELERRLHTRNTESPESRRRRLANARTELAAWAEYDFLIINRQPECAVTELRCLIAALRLRTRRLQEMPDHA